MERDIPYSQRGQDCLDGPEWLKYLFTREPLFILFVVLADVDEFRALKITNLNSSRGSTRRELNMSVATSPIYQLGGTYVEELVLRLAAARWGGLSTLLALWSASVVILYEVIRFICVALIATAFA
jgi:hypothetical protein